MDEMVMVSARKVGILKVFYALFTTLMDTQSSEPQMGDAELLGKLRQLNVRLKNEVMEHGTVETNETN